MVFGPGRKNRWLPGLGVGLAGAVLSLALWSAGWLDTWEAKTWDWRAASRAAPGPATDDIVLILLDQDSLDWARMENGLPWPWPREVYGAIIDHCSRNGARSVAFDVLFTEPSTWGVADDAALGDRVAAYGRFAGALFLGRTTGSETAWPEGVPRPRFAVEGLERWLSASGSGDRVFARAAFPVPELSGKAAVLGNVHMAPDKDGIYRSVPLLGVFDGAALPSLGLAAYLAAHPGTRLSLDASGLTIAGRTIPMDGRGHAILRYRGPSKTHKTFSAAAVLQSEMRIQAGRTPTIADPEAFRDKYVLFGFSAPGLYDLRSSPVDGVYPGVEIQATLLDNYLSGDFIRKAAPWVTVAVVLAVATACGMMAVLWRTPAGGLAAGLLFTVLPVGLCLLAYPRGFWLPLVVQEVAAGSAFALALVVNYATEGRQKRFIKGAFGQYLSPAVIEQLIAHPDRLKLGGERRVLSIFFSDLEGFTAISEGLAPEDLTGLLNDYLSAMTDIIHEEDGTVDKYEGDAIIAFWNAPLTVPDHAVRMVRAALRCQERLNELRPGFRNRIGRDMRMRIGMNTGPAVVGNMGSKNRFDYTMLGDAVNLAARLEGANKQFATYTMVSASTREMIGDAFPVRELARLAVVGRTEPVTVYEPLLPDAYAANRQRLLTFDKGLRLFYAGAVDDARTVFASIRDQDPPADAYVIQCTRMMAAPPEHWTGVWTLTTK